MKVEMAKENDEERTLIKMCELIKFAGITRNDLLGIWMGCISGPPPTRYLQFNFDGVTRG